MVQIPTSFDLNFQTFFFIYSSDFCFSSLLLTNFYLETYCYGLLGTQRQTLVAWSENVIEHVTYSQMDSSAHVRLELPRTRTSSLYQRAFQHVNMPPTVVLDPDNVRLSLNRLDIRTPKKKVCFSLIKQVQQHTKHLF